MGCRDVVRSCVGENTFLICVEETPSVRAGYSHLQTPFSISSYSFRWSSPITNTSAPYFRQYSFFSSSDSSRKTSSTHCQPTHFAQTENTVRRVPMVLSELTAMTLGSTG